MDFASDGAGYPVFCLSPLAIHSRNLIEEPRCSLVVQMPGWTGLANARVTIFGDVYQLPADLQVGGWGCGGSRQPNSNWLGVGLTGNMRGPVERLCAW